MDHLPGHPIRFVWLTRGQPGETIQQRKIGSWMEFAEDEMEALAILHYFDASLEVGKWNNRAFIAQAHLHGGAVSWEAAT
jgi:hypothetical protein